MQYAHPLIWDARIFTNSIRPSSMPAILGYKLTQPLEGSVAFGPELECLHCRSSVIMVSVSSDVPSVETRSCQLM